MSLYALDDLGDAIDVTREFLTPIEAWTWAKLAFVVFFVGTTAGSINPFSFVGNPGVAPDSGNAIEAGPDLWLLVGAVVAAVVLVGLAFLAVGSVMEFVFVEALRTGDVTVRRSWRERWRQGVRLFAFRVAVGLALLAGTGLLGAAVVLALLGLDPMGWVWIAAVFLLVPVFVLLAILGGLVYLFTTVFVVPIMVLEDCGVLDGWRRLWPSVRREWKEYLAYAVANLVLTIVAGIVVGFATAMLALALLLPFGVLFAVGVGLFVFVSEVVGLLALVAVGLAFLVALLVAFALVQVPVQSYLRYYALLVLGDVEPAYDLIPDRRDAVREGDSA